MDERWTSQELMMSDLFGRTRRQVQNSSRTKRMNVPVRLWNARDPNHAIAKAIAVLFLLFVLPGCRLIPDLRKPDPAPPPPENFINGMPPSESSADLLVTEFYDDPKVLCLIDQALSPVGNRELKILDEEVRIAGNEVLGQSGRYLPFLTLGATTGLDRYSYFSAEGAGIRDDPYLPGKYFPNPFGNYLGGLNLNWQIDIYRQLRNARDAAAQRYAAAIARRNFFITRLVADIAENYYTLVALDRRIENLDLTIALQERSLEVARAQFAAARGNELAVQRFQAEVRKNQSEKLIIRQDIIETENRINFLVNRFPQPVDRMTATFDVFFDMKIHDLSVGVPSQLLLNRPDIRQAERELEAAGLDVKVARVNFFPQLVITGGVGLQSFVMSHLFEPNAVLGDITGGLVGPLINFRAIRAQYLTANARQLQAIYNYERTILEAFTQVINRLTMVENYRQSIEIKKQQLAALMSSVEIASRLFQNARADYVDVLFAQRDMMNLIITKREQLSAIANAYQALGGGLNHRPTPQDFVGPPAPHDVAAAMQRAVTPPTGPVGPPKPPIPPPGPQPTAPVPARPEPPSDMPSALP
jgi:NodT family efflux transporter outer membrane factor (OMF) lipoprotein